MSNICLYWHDARVFWVVAIVWLLFTVTCKRYVIFGFMSTHQFVLFPGFLEVHTSISSALEYCPATSTCHHITKDLSEAYDTSQSHSLTCALFLVLYVTAKIYHTDSPYL